MLHGENSLSKPIYKMHFFVIWWWGMGKKKSFQKVLRFPHRDHFSFLHSPHKLLQNCENLVRVVSPCTSAEFQCKDRITCIHRSWVCDGEKDCPGGDDEMAPTCLNVTCRADQFQCKDRTCIAGALECSGKAECADGSDEVNCSEYYCINFPDGVECLR